MENIENIFRVKWKVYLKSFPSKNIKNEIPLAIRIIYE